MGLSFGGLYKLYGIVTYKVSPMHLKAFPCFIEHSVRNTLRRIVEQVPYVAPPLLAGVAIYYGVEWAHQQSLRKVPGEYDDDV